MALRNHERARVSLTTALLVALIALGVGCGLSGDAKGGLAPESAGITGPRLRVLGTVQDGGFPHAACRCNRCNSARVDPSQKRHVASLALVLPGVKPYLVDATPDVREQIELLSDLRDEPRETVDRSPVRGVFLTHAHMGHYLGLAFFGFEAVHTRHMPVYCTPRMAGYLRSNGPWSQLVSIGNVELRELIPGAARDLGEGITATPILVPHRDEYSDTVGFLFRGPRSGVLYVPDSEPWSNWRPDLIEVLESVDVAILDGTFFSEHELPGREVSQIGHPLITSTMDLLEPLVETGNLKVYLTHLNHSNPALEPDGPEFEEMTRRGFAILAEGQELPL